MFSEERHGNARVGRIAFVTLDARGAETDPHPGQRKSTLLKVTNKKRVVVSLSDSGLGIVT